MFTYHPIWDVSYLVAQCFVWGSAVFVANGLFHWLPLVAPSTKFPHEDSLAAGISSFIGTVFFQIGVTLLLLEAVNVNRTGCFGWAVEKVLEGMGVREEDDDGENRAGNKTRIRAASTIGGIRTEAGTNGARDGHRLTPPDPSTTPMPVMVRINRTIDACIHHHPTKGSLFAFHGYDRPNAGEFTKPPQKTASSGKNWTWWPTWHDLKTYYFHEIGFIYSAIFFVSGTIFWILGYTSLPGVYDHLSEAAMWGAFRVPDIIGSIGFVVGSYLIMLETQSNWYTPAPHILGWHVGFWKAIGSIGFTLSASFGIAYQVTEKDWLLYHTGLSTTWGSAAFLIASVVQWYESVNKHSVEKT
jgi:hypothetical protein